MTRPPEPEPPVLVTVTRTGGIAGMRRQWRAEPAGDDVPHWVDLIRECPWDEAAVATPPRGADMFVWRILAHLAVDGEPIQRDARLQDPQVQGPWQQLIDAVRDCDAAAGDA
jgi:hypothetical protein